MGYLVGVDNGNTMKSQCEFANGIIIAWHIPGQLVGHGGCEWWVGTVVVAVLLHEMWAGKRCWRGQLLVIVGGCRLQMDAREKRRAAVCSNAC